MRKAYAVVLAVTLGLVIWPALVSLWLVRYALFIVMVFLRPVVSFVFGSAAALFLLGLIFGLWMARDKHTMLWAFFGMGVASTAILFLYDALLLMLVPDRFPMLLAR